MLWAFPPQRETVVKTLIERSAVPGQARDKPLAMWSNVNFDRLGLLASKESQRWARGPLIFLEISWSCLAGVGGGGVVQGRERAFLCALWPGLWMNQFQPDIPAKLCNHTPKWGGNLSWGCLFQGWVYGGYRYHFLRGCFGRCPVNGFPEEARISPELVRMPQDRKRGREGEKREEGKNQRIDLFWVSGWCQAYENGNNVTLKRHVKIKRPFGWGGTGDLEMSKHLLRVKKLVKAQDLLYSKRLI